MIIAAIILAIFILYLQNCLEAQAEPLKGYVIYDKIKGMIGARINKSGFVSCVRYRSPAQLAGLRAGDRIVKIDLSRFALNRLNGCPGEHVRLTIARQEELIDLDVPFVDYRKIDYKTDPDRFFDEMGGLHEWADMEHENT